LIFLLDLMMVLKCLHMKRRWKDSRKPVW
jgi:hypothetical protein